MLFQDTKCKVVCFTAKHNQNTTFNFATRHANILNITELSVMYLHVDICIYKTQSRTFCIICLKVAFLRIPFWLSRLKLQCCQLWHGFNPCSWNFHMPWAHPKKKSSFSSPLENILNFCMSNYISALLFLVVALYIMIY